MHTLKVKLQVTLKHPAVSVSLYKGWRLLSEASGV